MYEKGLQTPQPLVHSTLNVAVAPRKKTARRPSRDPQRVHKITTCRKRIYIQYRNTLRIPQQRQRPASHVHFRRASGRGLGNVEEEIDSERTLSPEVKILFPLLPFVDTAQKLRQQNLLFGKGFVPCFTLHGCKISQNFQEDGNVHSDGYRWSTSVRVHLRTLLDTKDRAVA